MESKSVEVLVGGLGLELGLEPSNELKLTVGL